MKKARCACCSNDSRCACQNVRRRRKGKATSVDLDAYYWRFLEGGWAPRRPGTQLRGGRRTKSLQARRARASGGRVVRKPFIEPAFRAADARALSAFNAAFDAGAKKTAGLREYSSWATR